MLPSRSAMPKRSSSVSMKRTCNRDPTTKQLAAGNSRFAQRTGCATSAQGKQSCTRRQQPDATPHAPGSASVRRRTRWQQRAPGSGTAGPARRTCRRSSLRTPSLRWRQGQLGLHTNRIRYKLTVAGLAVANHDFGEALVGEQLVRGHLALAVIEPLHLASRTNPQAGTHRETRQRR